MNLRRLSLIDRLGLMFGSDVPQPEPMYFIEQEFYNEPYYRRAWFYLDAMGQKDHSHIPEKFQLGPECIEVKVKKTRNLKLLKLIQDKGGLTVEAENVR